MGDENLNGTEGQETAALFVSAQKRKKAEEEAARIAAEEQAKRDAAEAEVRRMEAEVADQKRKAEEERLALEQAAREEAYRAKQLANQQPIRDIKEAAGNKKGVFIGIGAAAAVVIVIAIIAVVISSRGKKIDFETLEASKSYSLKESGYEIELTYPEEIYPEVTEKVLDGDNLQIFFQPENKNTVLTDFVISTPRSEKKDYTYTLDRVALFEPESKMKEITDAAKAGLEKIAPSATISNEKASEYSDDNPGKYFYTFSFTSDDFGSGAAASWMEKNGDIDYKVVTLYCMKSDEDDETVTKLRDLLYEKNADNAHLMPGATPPANADLDDMLKEETMHMGIRVPKDRYVRFGVTTNYSLWSDINGSMIIAYASPTDVDFNDDSVSLDYEAIYEQLESLADTGLKYYFPDSVSSRTLINGERIGDGRFGYTGEYKDVMDGVTYYEKYTIKYWTDERTGKHYFATLLMLAPEKNKDIYKQIFEKSLDSLEDI